VVRTAIDMNVQRAAEEAAVENQLRQFGRDYHATQAATVVADLDGGVRAMVGGRDYGASQFNRAVRRDAPARLVVQALCLHHRAAERLQADLDRGRRPGLHRQLVPAELRPLLFRLGDADAGDHPLDQRRAGETVDRARRQAEPAKAGRAKITEVARRFGLKAPLPDTPSLPIGADEVTVLEHAVAYATFPNKGKSVTPHAVLEVRTGAGDLVWRFDRDGKKPLQAIPASVAADMAGMMSHVVSEGTARRAALDGIPTAGKTGTTNAYRDAWFVGYTGNFTCAVWYGNDDYSPTNRMTGGSLPAQTWHDIMVARTRASR
jgi:penicillin-binding protein 1A